MSSPERESVTVLEECIDLQKRKSRDYQNPNSNIKQAMHYRRGVSTIHDMVAQKMLRAQSLLEVVENGAVDAPNFESLEDTYKDAINYLSFAVSYIRGKMEGQDPDRDMLNRKINLASVIASNSVLNTHSDSLASKIAATYVKSVAPIGPIDVGDRIEEDMEDHRNAIRSQGK